MNYKKCELGDGIHSFVKVGISSTSLFGFDIELRIISQCSKCKKCKGEYVVWLEDEQKKLTEES